MSMICFCRLPRSIVVTGKFSDGTEVPLLDKTL